MTEEEILAAIVPAGHDTRLGACEACKFIEIYSGGSEERRCTVDISFLVGQPQAVIDLWKAAIAATLE